MTTEEFDEAKKTWLRVLICDWYDLPLTSVHGIQLINKYLDSIDIHTQLDSVIAVGFAPYLE